MDKAMAINTFWNSFGLSAFNEQSVPDIDPATQKELKPPYITYDVVLDNFGREVAMSAMLHYRDTSWRAINYKVEEINTAIGRGGKWLHFDDGACIIHRGQPFAQPLSDANDYLIKQFVINISCEFVTE
jgi:hypothetical protein